VIRSERADSGESVAGRGAMTRLRWPGFATRPKAGTIQVPMTAARKGTMGLFSSILDKLGLGGAKAAPAPEPVPEVIFVDPADLPPTAAAPVAIPVVDVMSQLEEKAAASAQKLNWKTSIVDLLKLLDLDSSFGARKEMAKELDCPEKLMGDSAQMNMWLHKEVLRRIAENGGNVPADLLD